MGNGLNEPGENEKICVTRTLPINSASNIAHRKLATAFSNAVALGKGLDRAEEVWYNATNMKIFSLIAPGVGACVALMFSACSSSDGDGYSESALPVSEVADGEIPPWLLEDDGTQQVGAGTHTPSISSRNNYTIPEPDEPKTTGARQNQPKLAEAGQDSTVVETPSGVVDPMASVTTASSASQRVQPRAAGASSGSSKGVGSKKGTSTKLVQGKKPKRPTLVVYKVRPGDNLTVIAKRSNTTVAQIQKDSNLKGTKIYPGQVIKVRFTPKGYKPEKDSKKAGKKSNSSNSVSTKTHTVAPGQSLSVIAAKYGVSVSALMKANGIPKSQADKIRSGSKLKIPAKR